VNFSEQPPSKEWVALRHRGEKIAEVWFKPDDEPFALTFRIPQSSFHLPGIAQRLTTENLLKAVGIVTTDVESWRSEGASSSEPGHPLPPPSADVPHLLLHVRLKPPPEAVASTESTAPEIPEEENNAQPAPAAASPTVPAAPEITEERWQDLEARWNAILGLEASIDTMRISLEGLRGEMEAASRKTLMGDEKVHAFNADVAVWTKAKSRVTYSLPKLKEFLHRATWAAGTPERKNLEELFKNYVRHRIPFPQIDQIPEQLEYLLKDRQVLSSHGTTVYQECKSICSEVQGALRTLQTNAAANAAKKRGASDARSRSLRR
jgi:hypothetical protein